MRYSDFIEVTKGMSHQSRSELFNEMSEEAQNELMNDYYAGAYPKEMLLQVRIIGAAEMIQAEIEKNGQRDNGKIVNWMKLYDQLVAELEMMKSD